MITLTDDQFEAILEALKVSKKAFEELGIKPEQSCLKLVNKALEEIQ